MKYFLSLVLFFLINNGLWDLIVAYGQVPEAWASFYVYLLLGFLMISFFYQEIGQSFRAMKERLQQPAFWLKRLVLPMLLAYAGTLLLTLLMGQVFQVDILPQNNENLKSIQDRLPLFLDWLMMVILVPLVEESVFRHSLLSWLPQDRPAPSTLMLIVSLFVFSAMHVDLSQAANWPSILYYLPLAGGLTWVYWQNDRELAASMLAHALTNLVAFFLLIANAI